MSTADRMKIVRNKLGLTQKNVAEELGISHRTWQDYENGRNLPNGKVLEKLAVMGFNINWVLTGEGPKEIDIGERIRHSFHYAHKRIRDEIKNKNKFEEITREITGEENAYKISGDQLESYVSDDGYLPTLDQIGKICKILKIENDKEFESAFEILIDVGNRVISSSRKIDKLLLRCTIEAVEDKKFGVNKISAREKADLVNFIYTMNLGTNYSTERLKRFLEAVLTIVDQVGDLNKVPDEKLSDLLLQIAIHAAKTEDKNK